MSDEPVSPPWPDQLGRGETKKRLLAMKVSELRSIADYEGIKVGPKKSDTVDRIMAVWFDKARPDFPPPTPPPAPPPSEPPIRPEGTLPLGTVVYPQGATPDTEPPPVHILVLGTRSEPSEVASPPEAPMVGVPARTPVFKDLFGGPFDRRATKKTLRGMTIEGIRAIADLEGIEHTSPRAVLDKYEIIVLILDIWQRRSLENASKGKSPTPFAEEPKSEARSIPRVGETVSAIPIAPESARTTIVEDPPAEPAAPGERNADNSWPLEIGRVETAKRLNAMKPSELEAIAENEGVPVGPKKADTVKRILKAWFEHRTASRYQGRARPEEPPPGVSARAKRIRESQANR